MGERELFPGMEKFYILLSVLVLISAWITILSINPIHSLVWLVITFLQSAIVLIGLHIDYIALILILIYVGAIAILFLFVIMMLDLMDYSEGISFGFWIPHILLFLNVFLYIIHPQFPIDSVSIWTWPLELNSQVQMIAYTLYIDYAFILIMISLVLLIAMIGAILLTLELGIITKRQTLSQQHQRNNSWI